MRETQDNPSVRSTLLSVMLTGVVGFLFLVLLLAVSGGLLLYPVMVVGGLAFLVMFNWMVWGKLMTRLTARERAAQARLQAEELHRDASETPWYTQNRYRR